MRCISLILVLGILLALGCQSLRDMSDSSPEHMQDGLLLSTSCRAARVGPKKSVEINVVFKNEGREVVEIKEGRLRGQFENSRHQNMFLQAVRASYKTGQRIIRLKPGEMYSEPLTLYPKKDAKKGVYKIKVLYHQDDKDPNGVEAGEISFRID